MEYFSLPAFDQTGLVKTVYTTSKDTIWKYGEKGSRENFTELGRTLGLEPERMVKTIQKHTFKVRIVTKENFGEGVVRPICGMVDGEDAAEGYDGLITNEKKLLLCTVEADCVPVYLLDTEKKVIGMVHSGWKGTVKKISAVAINKMIQTFGCKVEDILVGIGPHICKDCYEVGKDVFEEFQAGNFNLQQIFLKKNDEKYLLNLEEAVKLTVMECGVLEKNISTSGYCTFHSQERFCSYRRTKSASDRMLTAIMLV
jgi:YfiH family protein